MVVEHKGQGGTMERNKEFDPGVGRALPPRPGRPPGEPTAAERAEAEASKAEALKSHASEMYETTRETVSHAYDRTKDTLNRAYDRALDFGRENPGAAVLVGFGAGISVGLMLAGGFGRSRRQSVFPMLATSVADVLYDAFHRR
jgi:ElaB/YqjD/DUF883 family membrane-anchored ribosome-binding protein